MIQDTYRTLCDTPSDINEHLPTIKKYAQQSESIVELGVRYIVSTWALLAGNPQKLLSVDITHPKDFGADIMPVYKAAEDVGISFQFVQKSSLEIELPECDMLFIDTDHTFEQLSQELELHHTKVKKYIAMHDTNLDEFPEMVAAIHEFLVKHEDWKVEEIFENCHGMTFLKRV